MKSQNSFYIGMYGPERLIGNLQMLGANRDGDVRVDVVDETSHRRGEADD